MSDLNRDRVQKDFEDRLTHLCLEVTNIADKSMQAAILLTDIYYELLTVLREIDDFYIKLDDELDAMQNGSYEGEIESQ